MSRFHAVTGEQSRLRRWTLYLFARYVELPMLKWGYLILRGRHGRWGRNRLVRRLLSWAVVAPFGYAGDTAHPLPLTQTLEMINSLDGPIAVGPCRCRSSHNGCDHPLETDLVIRTGVEAWTRAFPHDYRLITKDEAKAIVSECSQLGLWQMVFVHCPVNRENEYVICNCCRCGCVPYILNQELGQHVYPLLQGDYLAFTDLARCTGHGDCVDICPFGVRSLRDGKAVMVSPCLGCGLCARVCPEGAIAMRRRSSDRLSSEPKSMGVSQPG